MRLIVIGSPVERRDLRERFERLDADIVAEFASLADARQSNVAADALVLTPPARRRLDDVSEIEELTPREIEVLELVALGLSNKAIAVRLGISDQTVKFHLASTTGKLGALNRTDAVRRAVRRGLIAL